MKILGVLACTVLLASTASLGAPGTDLGTLKKSLEGRIAVAERAEELRRREVEREEHESLGMLVARLGTDAAFRRWVDARAAALSREVEKLRPAAEHLAEKLAPAGRITETLRTFLSREDAAEILAVQLVGPRTRPDLLRASLWRVLSTGDDGRLVVSLAQRPAAEQSLAARRAELEAISGLAIRLSDLAKDIDVNDALGSRLRTCFRDRLLAVWSIHLGRRRDANAPAEAIAARGGEWYESALPKGDGGRRPLEKERKRLVATLDAFESQRPILEDVLRTARILAAKIRPGEELRETWAEFLRTECPVLMAMTTRPEADPVKVLLERTVLGRWLVRHETGAWYVNHHFAHEVEAGLRRILAEQARRGPLLRAVPDLGERSRAIADVLVDLARREAESRRDREPEGEALLAERLGSAEGKADAKEIRERTATIRRELSAEGARADLDPGNLNFREKGLHLLRSSSFYNPRTAAGGWFHAVGFDDHHASRIFGLFGWDGRVSKNLEEFLARIRKRKAGIERLAKTHDRIIVMINGMPSWLSASADSEPFKNEPGWSKANGHPPRDLEIWKRMVRETVMQFRDIEDAEILYEFWNEPDLHYWQAGLDEFLDLYEATVRTVKEVDPDAKVGGPSVNGWDNKLRGEPGMKRPLVIELIRAARKRKMPLDFVSWHFFGRPVPQIREAKETIEAECKRAGLDPIPEQFVTEWTTHARGTPFAASHLVETTVAFLEAGIDLQTISAWEEFHAKPSAGGFAPWGLITQQGARKNTWYVHRFLDRLSRDAEGWAVVPAKGKRGILATRKPGGILDLVVWDWSLSPRMDSAWKMLKKQGFETEDARHYLTVDRLERAIEAGWPRQEKWQAAFRRARKVLEEHPVQEDRLVLRIRGAKEIEVLAAESAWMDHEVRTDVAVHGDTLSCPLRQYEVLRLTIRIR